MRQRCVLPHRRTGPGSRRAAGYLVGQYEALCEAVSGVLSYALDWRALWSLSSNSEKLSTATMDQARGKNRASLMPLSNPHSR